MAMGLSIAVLVSTSVWADDESIRTSGLVVEGIETLMANGGRASFSKILDLIAFDYRGEDQFYDIHVMPPDRSVSWCLTCDRNDIPQRHIGQPAWHPSGKFLAFQAEAPDLDTGRLSERLANFLKSPGLGINNNIWIMSADGERYWRITRVKSRLGVLHPAFSEDGTRLVWAEALRRSYNGLKWGIKLADFHIAGDTPVVGNIRTYTPGGFSLYKPHGFSPDGSRILYSAGPGSRDFYHLEIYLFNPMADAWKQLTENDEWDDYPRFSPDGRHIVWASSLGQSETRETQGLLTDYWIMRSDGSGKKRLTYFNNPLAPEYIPGGVVAADCEWAPEGDGLMAFLILKENKKYDFQRNTRLVRIDFNPDELFSPE